MKNREWRAFTKQKAVSVILRIVIYLLLLDLAYVFLYPVIYMIITSLKSPTDILDTSVTWLLNEVHTGNYSLAWNTLSYPSHLLNTLFLAILSTAGHVFSCSYVGYGFARFNFFGKKLLFGILLMSIIIPPQTLIIPVYMLFSKVSLAGGFLPIILPTFFGFGLKGALFIFVFRQSYISLPVSLEEAASIDGCGPLRTFFSIVFPSSRSSVVVCIVLSIVWHWNDYFEPSIYITRMKNYLLPMLLPGLYSILDSSGGMSMEDMSGEMSSLYTEGVVMAATFLVIIPVFIMYIFLQKKFVQGIESSGLTGE